MIGFVNKGSTAQQNVPATTLAATIPATGAGNDLLVGVSNGNAAGQPGNPPVAVVSVTATGATFEFLGTLTNGSARTDVFVARNIPAGITSVSVTMASDTMFTIQCWEGAGVKAIGQVVTARGSTANPSIALTTQHPNNVMVAFFGEVDLSANSMAALTGNLRDFVFASGAIGNGDVAAALVDNTSATPASVTCAVTDIGTKNWTAIAVELWSVPNIPAAQGLM